MHRVGCVHRHTQACFRRIAADSCDDVACFCTNTRMQYDGCCECERYSFVRALSMHGAHFTAIAVHAGCVYVYRMTEHGATMSACVHVCMYVCWAQRRLCICGTYICVHIIYQATTINHTVADSTLLCCISVVGCIIAVRCRFQMIHSLY